MQDASGRPTTRIVLAQELSEMIWTFWQDARKGQLVRSTFTYPPDVCLTHPYLDQPLDPQASGYGQSKWAINNIRFSQIRLVALNYYHNLWVPVLAVDAD